MKNCQMSGKNAQGNFEFFFLTGVHVFAVFFASPTQPKKGREKNEKKTFIFFLFFLSFSLSFSLSLYTHFGFF
jgi:hypothetical protein